MGKCKDCKWWDGVLNSDGEGAGDCHRKAPIPKLWNGELSDIEHNPDYFYCRWPNTLFDYWCGEFEAKE